MARNIPRTEKEESRRAQKPPKILTHKLPKEDGVGKVHKIPGVSSEETKGGATVKVPKSHPDYYQKLMKKRIQSEYNKNVNKMALVGATRGRMLMRWLDKPRFVYLMQRLQKDIERGHGDWIGTLHAIVKLVGDSLAKELKSKSPSTKKPNASFGRYSGHNPAEKAIHAYAKFSKSVTEENANELYDAVLGWVKYIHQFAKVPVETQINFKRALNVGSFLSTIDDDPVGAYFKNEKTRQHKEMAAHIEQWSRTGEIDPVVLSQIKGHYRGHFIGNTPAGNGKAGYDIFNATAGLLRTLGIEDHSSVPYLAALTAKYLKTPPMGKTKDDVSKEDHEDDFHLLLNQVRGSHVSKEAVKSHLNRVRNMLGNIVSDQY